MSLSHRRRRLSLATAAVLAMSLPAAGVTLAGGSAVAADPAADCTQAFPVADLEDGDAVTGLTVTKGTEPTGFTGEILGILEDGIAPGVDMIIADLDMPEFDRTGGVWAGMSGSPVYAEDGRLIGAVAYSLSLGASPIAGITPFEEMDDYLAPPADRVRLTGRDASRVADRAGISRAEASEGLRILPVPEGVTGVSAARLAHLKTRFPKRVPQDTHVAGKVSADAAGAETIVAGGNIATTAAYGDVVLGGVGTATSVCDGRVVAFGHPAYFLGTTTEAMHPASAVYVQPDLLSPFKVANFAPPVGTVTDDRLTGITGTFGTPPAGTEIRSTVSYRDRSRTGTTTSVVPDATFIATLFHIAGNYDRVTDGDAFRASQVSTWKISGTQAGTPFTLRYTDRATGYYLNEETAFGVADLVSTLQGLDDVTLDTVESEAAVTDETRTHRVMFVEQLRSGKWERVTRGKPAVGKVGGTARLRVILGGTAGRRVVPLRPMAMPTRGRGQVAQISVVGGDSIYTYLEGASTIEDVKAALAAQLRSDQVRIQVGTPDRVQGGGGEDGPEEDLRRAVKPVSFLRTQTSAPLPFVVGDSISLPFVLR